MGHLTDALQDVRTVVAQIQADWTAYDLAVELDNRDNIDYGTQTDPYLQVSLVPMGGAQADMNEHPLVEQRGQILLSVVTKGGSGSIAAAQLLEFAMGYFDMKELGTVRCHAAVAVKPRDFKGWWYTPAIVDYWYHRTSN